MWVNEKLLKGNKKAENWSPDAPQEKKVWGFCEDCGATIYETTSYWYVPNRIVCIDCWKPYHEKGVGFHDCAGFDPYITLTV